MRFTILGGFLGAGKTTLLNRILASDYARDSVVLVNDFGKISIDSHLVRARGNRVITLANGCICCSIGNAFVTALIEITRRPPLPQRLIVEASGVADPAKIAEFAATDTHFVLERTPVVVDAVAFSAQRSDPRIADLVQRQLAAADIVVLNKIDVASDAVARETEEWVAAHYPRRPIFRTREANVPLAALFEGATSHTVLRASSDSLGAGHDEDFESFDFGSDRSFERSRLESVLTMLPPDVVRGKGLLRLSGEDGSAWVFQMVGPRWSLTRASDDLQAQRGSQLSFVGLSGRLKREALHSLLTAALVA